MNGSPCVCMDHEKGRPFPSLGITLSPSRLIFRGCNTNSVSIKQFGDIFEIAKPDSWSVTNQTVCEGDRDSTIRNLFNTVRRSVRGPNRLSLYDEKGSVVFNLASLT